MVEDIARVEIPVMPDLARGRVLVARMEIGEESTDALAERLQLPLVPCIRLQVQPRQILAELFPGRRAGDKEVPDMLLLRSLQADDTVGEGEVLVPHQARVLSQQGLALLGVRGQIRTPPRLGDPFQRPEVAPPGTSAEDPDASGHTYPPGRRTLQGLPGRQKLRKLPQVRRRVEARSRHGQGAQAPQTAARRQRTSAALGHGFCRHRSERDPLGRARSRALARPPDY
mmetsp:Transcript_38040/g.80883  ORF Transcript_38040/g.80883 Transcript_38040/m.80883 type:complete len:228 (-) Transcript_38040:9-692(-)